MVEWELPEPVAIATGITLASYVRASYRPLPDITAYELAMLLPYFLGKSMPEEDWTALGTAQRHLKRDPQ